MNVDILDTILDIGLNIIKQGKNIKTSNQIEPKSPSCLSFEDFKTWANYLPHHILLLAKATILLTALMYHHSYPFKLIPSKASADTDM